jgi:hypothetical protein
MYSSARPIAARRVGSAHAAGSGTAPPIGATSCGDVPHVTVGATSAASTTTSRSYAAPASDASDAQCATAARHSGESSAGSIGRPRR